MKKYLIILPVVPLIFAFVNCSSGFTPIDSLTSSSSGLDSSGGGTIGDASTDPLMALAWHLSNSGQIDYAATAAVAGNDLNLASTWASGDYGSGVKVMVSDDGSESTHEDLAANFNPNKVSKDYTLPSPFLSYTSLPKGPEDNHGTAVSGIIAAVGWNGVGSRGVAPKATYAIAAFLSSAATQSTASYVDQANGDFDVFSMSWGASQDSLYDADPSFEAQLKYGTTSLRAGRGANYVKAAGNDFYVFCNGSTTKYCIGNSNFDPDNSNPYLIVVAALNAKGKSSSYSSPGSDLWISGFGGEYGSATTTNDKKGKSAADSPTIITTDRMGCTNGYAASNATSAFEKGATPNNASCNYTSGFNGTSAATPTITGSVALMLSANPNLTWRDVRYILAKTATKIDVNIGDITAHPLGLALPAGVIWEKGWVTNAAGFNFHNWYGFGRVNVDAAVAMAKNFVSPLGAYMNSAFADTTGTLALAIPDNSASGVSSTMAVARSMKIESVRLKLFVTHPYVSDLQIQLTSPSGTQSILINMRSALDGIKNIQGEVLLTNAFFQENSAGTWTLKVIDGAPANAGTLTKWALDFSGAP
ncbi:S8 family peptidase [soil metagenome]